jgi:hypothetical protein
MCFWFYHDKVRYRKSENYFAYCFSCATVENRFEKVRNDHIFENLKKDIDMRIGRRFENLKKGHRSEVQMSVT